MSEEICRCCGNEPAPNSECDLCGLKGPERSEWDIQLDRELSRGEELRDMER